MKKLIFCIMLSLGILLVSGCDAVPESPENSASTTASSPANIEIHIVSADTLNANVFDVVSADPHIVQAQLDENGDIRITACRPGTAVLTARNHYGESFEITVTCDEDLQITAEGRYVPPETSVTVTDFGAIPDDERDDTKAIQKAIDSLPQGGTVYVPAGVYQVSQIILRENISLRLEGILEDYTAAYWESGAMDLVFEDRIAVLRTVGGFHMFLNHERWDHGRNGCSNFSVSGGMLDLQGQVGAFVLACAENVTLENLIIKDCPNDHAIQIAGSRNVTIRDCMFAGYNYVSNNTTAEVIQIEQTHPGAIGAVGKTVSVFEDGEYYVCENISITGCYFGESDLYDAPTYAIGHHGQVHKSAVTGLQIADCVFDNCRCSAITYPSFSDVTICRNTFINNRDNCVSPLTAPYQIMLTALDPTVSVTAQTDSGESVTAYYAKNYACEGSIGTVIENNTFILGSACSNYGAVSAAGKERSHDILHEDGAYTVAGFGAPVVYYAGYVPVRNRIADLTVRDNRIITDVDTDASGFFYTFMNVHGLSVTGNTVEGKTFNNCSSIFAGQDLPNCRVIQCTPMDTVRQTLKIQIPAGLTALLSTDSGETARLKNVSANAITVTVTAQGGSVQYSTDETGTLTVLLSPDEGKSLREFTLPAGITEAPDGSWQCEYSTIITAVFQ